MNETKLAEWEAVRGDGHAVRLALFGGPANPHAVVTHGPKDAPTEVFCSGPLLTLMGCVAATHFLLSKISEEARRGTEGTDGQAPTGAA